MTLWKGSLEKIVLFHLPFARSGLLLCLTASLCNMPLDVEGFDCLQKYYRESVRITQYYHCNILLRSDVVTWYINGGKRAEKKKDTSSLLERTS